MHTTSHLLSYPGDSMLTSIPGEKCCDFRPRRQQSGPLVLVVRKPRPRDPGKVRGKPQAPEEGRQVRGRRIGRYVTFNSTQLLSP